MRRIDRTSDKDLMSIVEIFWSFCTFLDIPWLEETLHTHLRNHAQWTSPIIQNELLENFSDLTTELICKAVRESGWYGTIIATSDICRDEQVSFCLSYIASERQ